MAEPIQEQTVRIVLIPEALYKKLEKIARKNNATVSGLTCRALVDFLDRPPRKNKEKRARNTTTTKKLKIPRAPFLMTLLQARDGI